MFKNFLWCLLGILSLAQSQNISFADTNFKKALLTHDPYIDKNNDKEISQLEAEAVRELKLASKNIKSLDGIEYFTQLNTIDCSANQLTSISFPKNDGLEYLDCSSNQLTSIGIDSNGVLHDLYCQDNLLSSFKVSPTAPLMNLYCDSNKFVTMDLSFGTLGVFSCSNNLLTSLDVSANDFLLYFFCKNNPQLSVICVSASQSRSNWKKDQSMSYSTTCATDYKDQIVDPSQKEVSKIYNLQGQEVPMAGSEPLIYLYKDGTREKRIRIEK
jgi:Leucine-rich repeat (LRR) protein